MAPGRFAEAIRRWQGGEYREAEALCRATIEADATNADARRLLAEILAGSGRWPEAIVACRQVAELAPLDAANQRRLAELFSQTRDFASAESALERALKLEPNNARALNNLGNLLTRLGRLSEAIPLFEQAIVVQPAYPIALNNLGLAMARSGRLDEAIAHYERALALQASFPEALNNLANALISRGRLTEAMRCHERVDALRSPAPAELAGRGDRLLSLGLAAEALAAFDRALHAAPLLPAAHIGRIHALLAADRPTDALTACEVLLVRRPSSDAFPGLLGLRACALLELKRTPEALTAATEATVADPQDAQAFLALGFARVLSGRAADALDAFDHVLELRPTLAKAHGGRGLALAAVGKADEAIAAYERAAALDPRDSAVFLEVGQLMLRLGRHANAHAAFCAASELQPGHRSALEGRAMTLIALNRHEEALPLLTALEASGPPMDYLPGIKFHSQLHCCEWRDYDASSHAIGAGVRRGERVEAPFSFLAHGQSAADQRLCAQTFVADRCRVEHRPMARGECLGGSRLRIAYLSSDFGDHPVGQLIAGLLESHDRSRFEIYALSAAPKTDSPLRRRLERAVDHFLEMAALQDAAYAAQMAELSIDIAVDLGGHTTGSRTRVLALRPAPLQVSFLGYPGTSGADFMDYIVADRHVIPEPDQIHYSEQVIYLPDTYLPNDFAVPSAIAPTRAEAGLPADGFVYCSFNAPYKISPALFDVWIRILTAVPDSVLWLREASAAVKKNLAREAERRGADPARLIYAPRVPTHTAHGARLSLADLFLDTSPYNAHTTASDALGAGVPVITMRGKTFASRVATSLLHACDLGHLAVQTAEEYEQLAITLGRTPPLVTDLKAHLGRVRTTAPLFDTVRFCRHLEAAYNEIWARHERGEGPSTLWVGPRSPSAS
jgi:protein O-GlcNAc transferase